MNKKLFSFLISIAVVIRLVFAVSTYHSDLGAFALAGKYIAGEGKWLSFYDTIASKDDTGKLVVHRTDMIFNYQPLAYLIPSIMYLPFASTVRDTGDKLITREWLSSNTSNINFILLLYKLPMILADLGILWLIAKFFKKLKNKRTAMLLWAFNPVSIYVSSIMGQVDIVIAFFILLGLYGVCTGHFYRAVLFVALSALIKPAGLILIPLIALGFFTRYRQLTKSIFIALFGVGVYVLGVLPYIASASYRHYALFAEQIGKSTFASISIASGHDIPYFFILLVTVALFVWKKKISITTGVGVALLASLIFTHFHPQWLVWIMPWLIIDTIRKQDYFVYLAMIVCWFGVLFSFDATLHLQTIIHSKAIIPDSIVNSGMYQQLIQLSRASLIGITLTFLIKR